MLYELPYVWLLGASLCFFARADTCTGGHKDFLTLDNAEFEADDCFNLLEIRAVEVLHHSRYASQLKDHGRASESVSLPPKRQAHNFFAFICAAFPVMNVCLLLAILPSSSLVVEAGHSVWIAWRIKALQVLGCLGVGLANMGISVLVPTAYNFAAVYGFGPTMSGILISSYFILYPFALIVAKLLLPPMHNMVVVSSAGMSGFWMIVFSVVAACAQSSRAMWAVLVILRAAAGFSECCYLVNSKVAVQFVTPKAHMGSLLMIWGLYSTLGLAFGPMMSSAVSLVTKEEHTHICTAVPVAVVGIYLISWSVVAWFVFPEDLAPLAEAKSAADCNMIVDSPLVHEQIDERRTVAKQQVWWAAVVFDAERAFISGAIEQGSALIYELEYGWATKRIGVVVGGAFLCGLPITALVRIVQQHSTDTIVACGLTFLSAMSSFLLWPNFGNWIFSGFGNFEGDVACIMCSEALMLPSAVLSKGILDAMAVEASSPGTFFTQQNLTLMQYSLGTFTGKVLAPPFTRWFLSSLGRWQYSLLMLVLSVWGFFTVLKACQEVAIMRVGSIREPQESPAPGREPQKITNKTPA